MSQQTDIVAREKRRQELGTLEFSKGKQGGALMQPKNGKELMDMANMMSASGQMIRDFYRGNPGDCAALIMICQPYGLNPFMTSWKTYKASKSADAPVSFEGQLVNAMVNMSAPVKGRLKYAYEGEGPTRQCTVTGIDRETGDEITYTTPKLQAIPIKNSPLWKGDPDQQLGYYAARSWARRHFPELLLGVYTREEIDEAPRIRDVTPPKENHVTLSQRLAEAKAEDFDQTPDIEDANLDQTEPADESTTGHWTDDVDANEGAPGTAEWNEGQDAAKQGAPITDCPYEDSMEAAQDWCGGWAGERKAAS
jgi:hypothetical protein